MEYIGIDTGRYATKLSSLNRAISFPSKVGEWRQLRLGDGGDYEVSINGNRYFVGWLAEESRFRRQNAVESKIHEDTKILFLTALALADTENAVTITTGVPVEQHTPAFKAGLNAMLKGLHKVTVNGYQGTFAIDSVQIMPEGAGAFWGEVLDDRGLIINPTLTKQRRVRVIDLGSRTTNYVTLSEGRYLDRDSGTLGYGCLELENGTGEETERELLAKRIIADLAKKWPDWMGTDSIIIAGGGALIMGQYFKRQFPLLQVAKDPAMANAIGYRKLGMVYARQNQGRVL